MKKVWNKYTRNVSVIVLATVFTGVALYMNKSYVDARVQTRAVLVPKENIKPFHSLKDNLTVRDVVVSEIPSDAIVDAADLQGQEWYTGDVGLIKGTPIRKSLITTSKTSPFGQALSVKQGNKLIGVATDLARSAGDSIKPGVLVDAYVYIKGDQQRRAMTIGPNEDPDLAALLVRDRQNQEGVTVGEQENKSRVPVVAVLEVSDKIGIKLVQYQEEGKVYLLPSGVDKDYIEQYLKEDKKSKEVQEALDAAKNTITK